jgi:hypothetical protein
MVSSFGHANAHKHKIPDTLSAAVEKANIHRLHKLARIWHSIHIYPLSKTIAIVLLGVVDRNIYVRSSKKSNLARLEIDLRYVLGREVTRTTECNPASGAI